MGPTVRNTKTGKCDCPKGSERDSKTQTCFIKVVSHICKKGYKKVGKDQCVKTIVHYKHVCPKGYVMKDKKCYKHTTTVKYQDPTPDPTEDRLACILRFAGMIKQLTDVKEKLSNEYT